MKTLFCTLLISLFVCQFALAQEFLGRWETTEAGLEVTRVLQSGILRVNQPQSATRPARNRHIVEFTPDGRARMNNETGTYQFNGKTLDVTINGKTEPYTVFRNGDQLQLLGYNVVGGEPGTATARAIMMTRQMGMADQFNLQPSDRVKSVRIGIYLRYLGEARQQAGGYQPQPNNGGYPDRPTTTAVPCEVTPTDLDRIRQRIENATFDSEKPKVFRAALASKRCFTAEQIVELLALFPFDSEKLPLAKYAYSYCADRDNYYLVGDAMDFPASKDQLETFIRSRR